MKAIVIVLVLLCIGCNSRQAELSTDLRAYNDALIDAYRSGDMKPLREVAGEKEQRKVESLVDLKRAAGVVLEASLESFEVTKVESVGANGATVETRERWRYHDRALVPGREIAPVFVSEMTMKYDCVKEHHRWRVLNVRTLSNDFIEPKGHQVAQTAHGSKSE